MADDDKPATTPIEVVYMGRYETVQRKLAIRLIPLALYRELSTDINALEEAASLFEVKGHFHKAIGAVYTITGALGDKGTLQRAASGSMKLVANHDGIIRADWIARWEAHSKASLVAQRVRKIEDDLKKDSKLVRALAGLKDRYGETDRIGRMALEVVVLDVIRSSSSYRQEQ